MKKGIAIFLSICMVLALLPERVYAASETASKDEVYITYYDFLKEQLDAVGYIQPSALNTLTASGHDINIFYPKREGVVYAKLIDFDRDDTDELYLIESVRSERHLYDNYYSYNLHWNVYSYKTGNVVHLAGSQIIRGYFGFITDKTGKINYYETERQYSWDDFTCYSLSNGKFTETSVMISWTPDWSFSGTINGQHVSGSSDTMHGDGSGWITIDGDRRYASENEIKALREEVSSGGLEIYDYVSRPADNAVQSLMQQIESKYLPSNCYIPSSWAQSTVTQAISTGIVPISLQKRYQTPITRSEFCTLAANLYESTIGTTITKTAQFNDASDINVQKMAGLGIVSGIGDGKFNPDGLLTREAAAVILARLADALYITLDNAVPTFADNSNISSWAFEQVGQIQASGIMSGVGNNQFSPKSTYTREQSIATVMRIKDMVAQVTGLTLSDSELVIPTNSSAQLTATIYSENAANKNLTWTCSAPNYMVKVDNNGLVTTLTDWEIREPVTVTVTAASGISASCQIRVSDKDHVDFSTELPVTVNFLALPDGRIPYNSGIDFVPDNPTLIGALTINEIESTMSSSFQMLKVSAVVSQNEYGYDNYTYLKWIVEDTHGQIIDSGIEQLRFSKELGKTVNVSIVVHNTTPGQSYTICFISDEGKTSNNVAVTSPQLRVVGTPLTVSETSLYSKESTTTVANATLETTYNANRSCWYGSITFIGSADIPSYMGPKFQWSLEDENGNVVASGTSYVLKSGVDRNGSFTLEPRFATKNIKLESGQTYTLRLSES